MERPVRCIRRCQTRTAQKDRAQKSNPLRDRNVRTSVRAGPSADKRPRLINLVRGGMKNRTALLAGGNQSSMRGASPQTDLCRRPQAGSLHKRYEASHEAIRLRFKYASTACTTKMLKLMVPARAMRISNIRLNPNVLAFNSVWRLYLYRASVSKRFLRRGKWFHLNESQSF
jgi:hypothetical protein